MFSVGCVSVVIVSNTSFVVSMIVVSCVTGVGVTSGIWLLFLLVRDGVLSVFWLMLLSLLVGLSWGCWSYFIRKYRPG